MKLTVRARLFLGFGLVVAIMTILGLYSTTALRGVNEKTAEITSNWLPGVDRIHTVDTAISDFRIKEYRHIIATSPEEISQMEQEMAALKKEIDNKLLEYEKTIADDVDRKMFNNVKTEWEKYLLVGQEVSALSREHKTDEAMNLMRNESNQSFKSMETTLQDLVKYNQANGDRVSKESEEIYARSKFLITIAIIIAMVLGAGVAFFISRSISNPLREIENLATQLAEGDLRSNDIIVKNRDEIGVLAEAFNQMKNNLKGVISQLTGTAQQVADTSFGLASQADQTSAAASENAATVEEIASTVDHVAQNANNVSVISEGISKNASQGTEGIERLNKQINAISTVSEKSTQIIEELSHTLAKVNQIIDLITGIADQTNLLALNAAIEAARAGEQGRGFAVVAEEVRKLAEQSAGAAKEINQLISNVQSESKLAVEAMNDGNREVREGVQIVDEVGVLLEGILTEISGLSDKIQDVAAAAEQVSAGVQNVASSTEEQTAAMEEVSAATSDLKRMANDMNQLANKFKL